MIVTILRVVAILIGVVLLGFGLFDLVVPRARFVSSNPPAAAVLATPPNAVTINFSEMLAPESTIDVTSTIRLLPAGELEYLDGRSVVIASGIDPGDPAGKSLRAGLRPDLHQGLYWVSWRTTTAGWRTVTSGRTYFSVGMAAPEAVTRDLGGSVWERNYQWRSRRRAILGGVIMIVLGLMIGLRKRAEQNERG